MYDINSISFHRCLCGCYSLFFAWLASAHVSAPYVILELFAYYYIKLYFDVVH